MNHIFAITGISCNNCIQKITKLLNEQFEVKNLSFTNNNSQISFDAKQNITIDQINQALTILGKYRIENIAVNISEKSNEQPASYKPIFLLLGYIITANLLITAHEFRLENFMTNFMASFFLVFSFFKLLDLQGFADGYSSYDIIAKKFYYYAYIYPFIELLFGVSYIVFNINLYLNIAVFIIMFISSIGVIQAKFSKQKFQCACVGTFLKVPLGNIAIIEDITMVIMSLFMIIKLI